MHARRDIRHGEANPSVTCSVNYGILDVESISTALRYVNDVDVHS